MSAFRTDPFRVVLLDDDIVIRIAENLDDFARTLLLLLLLFGIRVGCCFANDIAANLDSGGRRTSPFGSRWYRSARGRSGAKEPFDALLTPFQTFQAEKAQRQLQKVSISGLSESATRKCVLTLLTFIAGFPPDDRVIGSVTSSHNLLAYLAMYSVVKFLVNGNVVCLERCVSKAEPDCQPRCQRRFSGSHLAACPGQDSWATNLP